MIHWCVYEKHVNNNQLNQQEKTQEFFQVKYCKWIGNAPSFSAIVNHNSFIVRRANERITRGRKVGVVNVVRTRVFLERPEKPKRPQCLVINHRRSRGWRSRAREVRRLMKRHSWWPLLIRSRSRIVRRTSWSGKPPCHFTLREPKKDQIPVPKFSIKKRQSQVRKNILELQMREWQDDKNEKSQHWVSKSTNQLRWFSSPC